MTQAESLWGMSIIEFRDAVATNPTPGSGAVAAASASFGVALLLKALNLGATDAKKPDARPPTQQEGEGNRSEELVEAAQNLLNELVSLAERDMAAFGRYMEAVHLPRSTVSQRDARDRSCAEAGEEICAIPLEIARACQAGLPFALASLPLTQANLRSDVLCAARLMHAGLCTALIVVESNLEVLSDKSERERFVRRQQRLQQCADDALENIHKRSADKLASPASP